MNEVYQITVKFPYPKCEGETQETMRVWLQEEIADRLSIAASEVIVHVEPTANTSNIESLLCGRE